MKKLVLAVMITLFCSLAGAQVYQPISGWCQVGGQGVYAAPSGGQVPIQQYTQGSYTGCTITIYNHGTLVPAAIYSTSGGVSQGNPFQANVLGFYQAFAATGLYDVQESGTINPPVSLGTVSLFDTTTYSPAGGSTNQVQYNCSGLLCGNSGLIFVPSLQTLEVSGTILAGNATVAGVISSGGPATFPATAVSSLSDTGSASVTGLSTLLGGVYAGGGVDAQMNVAQTAGGYIQFPPITYPSLTCLDTYGNQVNIPTPTPGMPAFGANDLLLWNSLSPLPPRAGSPGGCPTALPPNVIYGINTNGYLFARGGYATDETAFNAFHAFTGGVTAASITAGGFYPPGTVTACCGTLSTFTYIGGYVAVGHSVGPPAAGTVATVNNPLTQYDGLEQGTLYWDDTLACISVYNGTTWNCIGGGGGGGSPTGPRYSIQSNNPLGSLYGDANLSYTPGTTSYVTLNNGVFSALGTTGGFDAPTGNAYNTIQAPLGGTYSLVHTSLNYTFPGSYTTTLASGPPVAPNASFTAGDLSYYAGGSPCLVYYTGSTWSCIGGGSPGSPSTSVQFNSSGAFAGSANLEWNNSGQALQITGVTATAGLYVKTSYIESDQGFEAISATGGSNFNSFQAYCTGGPPCTTFVGGMAARSFTAQTYVQIGNAASTPTVTLNDTFNPGAAYFDTTSNCLKVFNNSSTWGCLASGSSSPGGANTNIQFNSSGTFGGSANLVWTNSAHTLTIQGLTGTPGLQVNTSYITVDQGLEVTSATGGSNFNSIQAYCTGGPPCTTFVGGMAARSFTAQTYIQSGSASSTPTVTTNDSFNAGAMYYNTTSNCEEVYSGSAWICLSSLFTLSGVDVYPISTSYKLLLGETSIVDSAAVLEVNGGTNGLGVFQSQLVACTPSPTCTSPVAFQTSDGSGHNYLIADANGDISLSGQLNVNNTASANGTAASAALFTTNSSTHPSVVVVNPSGFGLYSAASANGDFLAKLTSGTASVTSSLTLTGATITAPSGSTPLNTTITCPGGQHIYTLTISYGFVMNYACN